MGLKTRIKQVPHGARDFANEAIETGVFGAVLNGVAKFGEKNAAARQTIGDDHILG